MLHSLTSAEYVRDIVRPGVADGAARAERALADVKVSGGGFIITGPDQSSIREAKAEVRRRIAFYASTRTYFPVLECHGFDVGPQLHQMSLRGEWGEMGELVSDEMLDAFAVIGEYDEIADKYLERYGGLLDEMSLSLTTAAPVEEAQLRRIIARFHDAG